MAAEACAIVSSIRFEEQQTLWTSDYENSLSDGTAGDIFPGMMFSLARGKIEQSKLWKIVKKMPKGALLHCHLEAMVNLDWLIDEAFATDGMHIKADVCLATAEARDKDQFTFRYLRETAQGGESIWSQSYQAGQAVPLQQAAECFPDGGKDGFKRWFKSRVTITLEDNLKHHHGPNDIWRKFTPSFGIIGSLMHYEPIFRKFVHNMLNELVDDGVQYVDLRAAFVIPFYKEGSETPEDGFATYMGVLDEEITKFKASDEGKGFWGARMIWTSIRSFGTKSIIEGKAVETKFQPLQAGVTSWGHEMKPSSSTKYTGSGLYSVTDENRHARVHRCQTAISAPYRRLRPRRTRRPRTTTGRPYS